VRYSPSGSSSGTATAVAARMATAGIGTQTGGSVTSPGMSQGLTCVKPTFGRISLHGVVPLTYTRDHVGPMCRTALDAAIMLQVLAKPDPNDPRTLGLPAPPDYTRAATVIGGNRPRLRWPTRIGVWPGYTSTNDAEVNAMRTAMIGELEGFGATIVPDVTLPDNWAALTSGALGGSTADPTGPFLEFLRRDVRDFADRLPRFLNGMLQSGDTTLKVQQARYLLLQRIMSQLFSQCDLVLTTSSGPFDGTGLPLACFPIGFQADTTTGYDVPRGALLAGPPFSEERLLAVAAAYQAVTGFHLVRPPDPTGTTVSALQRTTLSAGADEILPFDVNPDEME
jgi:Asp-tRNA(Asn)/Glu-tRNA(Gln) amidotransferase A subunit family amidase